MIQIKDNDDFDDGEIEYTINGETKQNKNTYWRWVSITDYIKVGLWLLCCDCLSNVIMRLLVMI